MNKPCNKCKNALEVNGRKYKRYSEECRECEKLKKYLAYLESKRKYIADIPAENIDDILNNEWFIWNGKTVHRTVIKNQQLAFLLSQIKHLCIFIAKKK